MAIKRRGWDRSKPNARAPGARRLPSVLVLRWQVSSTDARRFFFTTEEESYGAWLGRDANLGVIEAVVYREKKPRLTIPASRSF